MTLSVPLSATRHALSDLVNHLLAELKQPLAFDFLVQGICKTLADLCPIQKMLAASPSPCSFVVGSSISAGELLRDSLANFLFAREISLESVIPVQYILAVLPPHVSREIKSENWVRREKENQNGKTELGSQGPAAINTVIFGERKKESL